MNKPFYHLQSAQLRYQFYREHKRLSALANDVERAIAKADFTLDNQIDDIKKQLDQLFYLIEEHAHYEDSQIHPLLEKKNSDAHQKAQQDHRDHEKLFIALQNELGDVKKATDKVIKINLGYQFHLNYRHYVAELLFHFHEEETHVLPELQKLFSDTELSAVDAAVYKSIGTDPYHVVNPVEELINMMKTLAPHMNRFDREATLLELQKARPDDFKAIWDGCKVVIDPAEQNTLSQTLGL